jgi:predicted nucleic acid-binding protein
MVILVDTSAWIAFLRGTGSPACHKLRTVLAADEVATTDIVQLELLMGARDNHHLRQLRGLLAAVDHLPIAAGLDAERAAELYRTCRRAGETPRQAADCLIAAVALRRDVALLHEDRDFDAIARHCSLEILPTGP